MSQRLKIGLIGAGVFAGYHANKLASHRRVEFVGLHDPDEERANALAKKHGVIAFSAQDLYAASDAVIIACPASFHGDMALAAIEAGCHCLIEKPLASTVKQAEQIATLSQARDLIIQVGHQERIVMKAIGLDRVKEKPLHIKAIRANPYSLRGTDTSVTMDLMTHDIDICTFLFGGAPDLVTGETDFVRSSKADESQAVLHYGEARAHLRASRVVDVGERSMKITFPSGQVDIDFNAKRLTHDTPFDLNDDFGTDPRAKDSLGAATQVFIEAVLDGAPVMVSARDGLIAVKAAVQIDGEDQ